ncbi:pectinesterase inhibitor 9-like [Macadamia integrifolia]|uniref:pectinesterase inhibitor 9-like n=1 Tax=Macadamia integrifolia TaxID=60698 RepID=UPI001C4ED1FC|nr:pectinesterase inhibitor 9-like [Macadamia integrifolia]
MSQPTLSFLLLSILSIAAGMAESAAANRSSSIQYIKSSCSITRYPTLCVQTLSPYANKIQRNNPQQLAQAALSVSLSKSRSASAYVSKMTRLKTLKTREYEALKDCVDNMKDSVDRLSGSIKEMGQTSKSTGQSEFSWHMSNVQTWVSAALTDDNTCVDGFSGHSLDGNVKTAIKGTITTVAQVTSNALALINRYASSH